jgi:hypothetical protein
VSYQIPEGDPCGAAKYRVWNQDGRIGGCEPRRREIGVPGGLPVFETSKRITGIDRALWEPTPAPRWAERRDLNQNGYPACCLASLCNAMEIMAVLKGQPHRPLDWLKAWRKLSGGRGGVALDDAHEFAADTGMPLADGTGVVRILESLDCRTVDEYASGILQGAVGTYGHDVHAEAALGLAKDSKGRWCLDTRNSWGRDWGDKGWHLFPLSAVELNTYGAILIVEVSTPDPDFSAYKDVA